MVLPYPIILTAQRQGYVGPSDRLLMKILVLNCGSSSLKFKVFAAADLHWLAGGNAERIGQPDSVLRMTWMGGEEICAAAAPDHQSALQQVFRLLAQHGIVAGPAQLSAIGHRVVHGGDRFRAPLLLDAATLEELHQLTPLAPLHHPANLHGIELAAAFCPGLPQVAVFDTAFHHTLPPHAWRYALPAWTWRDHQVRRYGFHGTSVQYVSRCAAELMGRPLEQLNLIVLHLGNGASVTAVEGGRSVDTSMGMTPLEGLVMGTRTGNIDAAVPFYLMRHAGLDAAAAERLLFFDSGLYGLCGSSDMRTVHARADAGDADAQLALDITGYRLKKYIGAYSAALGRVDAVIFTAGIGENDADMRRRACDGLECLGIRLDEARNGAADSTARRISSDDSTVQLWVIPTDEELEIARQTRAAVETDKTG